MQCIFSMQRTLGLTGWGRSADIPGQGKYVAEPVVGSLRNTSYEIQQPPTTASSKELDTRHQVLP